MFFLLFLLLGSSDSGDGSGEGRDLGLEEFEIEEDDLSSLGDVGVGGSLWD